MAQEKPGGFFDRPLWRIIVPIILVSFVAHRVAAAVITHAAEGPALAVVSYTMQAVIALGAAVFIFRQRRTGGERREAG
jgi:hypothetical protein